MSQERRRVVGGPGCGKTTRLMGLLDEFLLDGIAPDKIALVSFTKKAAEEAQERAMKKFNLTAKDLRYFQTIHSLAFQQLQLTRSEVLQTSHYLELGNLLNVRFSGGVYMDDGVLVSKYEGDKFLFLDHLSRTSCLTLEEQYYRTAPDGINWFELKLFCETLASYKRENGLMDFTDMLEKYLEFCEPLNLDVAIIDEAQDLSPLQWKVALKAFSHAKVLIIAGDDDQAIYQWSGADVDVFLNFDGSTEILELSHRLPREIWSLANRISGRIGNRIPKNWRPRDEDGRVEYHAGLDGLEFTEGTWLLLARHGYLLPQLEVACQQQGLTYQVKGQNSVNEKQILAIQAWEELRKGRPVPHKVVAQMYEFLKAGSGVKKGYTSLSRTTTQATYTLKDLKVRYGLLREDIWHDALEMIPLVKREYYLGILKNGGNLLEPPRIKINTIHAVKGGEADHVVVLSDISKRTWEALSQGRDEEHRVAFVGVSRAKQSVHLVHPQTNLFYAF